MRHSTHAREVHCWKQHGTSHLILLYILIHFSAKSGWVGTFPFSLHDRSMECKLPFVPKCLVNLGFHLRLTKWDFKIRSRACCYHSVPMMDGPDLICCIFHYSSLNLLTIGATKSKSSRSSLLIICFITMFSESISTFPATSLQSFCVWDTNLLCLIG